MTKQAMSRKPVKQSAPVKRYPAIGELFFDQFKQVAGKIEKEGPLTRIIDVRFKTGVNTFRMNEIEWSERAGWWIFKQEEKQYFVWVESVSADKTKQGTWDKASNFAMTETTARALEKLLKLENPELDFAVSIGKPSSYVF